MNREYTSEHNEFKADQFFLQLILSTPSITEKDLKRKLDTVNSGLSDSQKRSLEQLLAYARRTLFPIDLEFRRFVDKNYSPDEYVYALISTEPFTDYLNKIFINPGEAVQLRKMIDMIFANSRCSGVGIRNFLKRDFPARDELLKRLLDTKRLIQLNENNHTNVDNGGYFFDNLIEQNARVSISTAFSQEIYDYLREHYYEKTLFDCAGCKEWVLAGILCQNENCNLRLHRSCYGPYFASNGIEEGVCPECKSQI